MNPAAILSLISDLYVEAAEAQRAKDLLAQQVMAMEAERGEQLHADPETPTTKKATK